MPQCWKLLAQVDWFLPKPNLGLVNYYGPVKNGDLVLDGDCAFCGHAAARVLEFSETDYRNNQNN